MKKVILGTVIAVSLAMADATPKDDLLAMATMGKTTGSQFEMNKSEMKDADGGKSWRIYGNPYNVYYPRYSSYRYSGRYFTIFTRR